MSAGVVICLRNWNTRGNDRSWPGCTSRLRCFVERQMTPLRCSSSRSGLRFQLLQFSQFLGSVANRSPKRPGSRTHSNLANSESTRAPPSGRNLRQCRTQGARVVRLAQSFATFLGLRSALEYVAKAQIEAKSRHRNKNIASLDAGVFLLIWSVRCANLRGACQLSH
jgi:hypothetical protein